VRTVVGAIIVALAGAAAIAIVGPGDSLDGRRAVVLAPERSLTVATIEGALPLSGTLPDGSLGGFHVHVARAVCDRLGVTCRFALVTPDDLLGALETGAVDMVAADLVRRPTNPEWAGVVFGRPYARRSSLWVARRTLVDATKAESPESAGDRGAAVHPEALGGRVLAVVAGSDQAAALRGSAPADATVVLAERQADVLRALRDGEADAALLPLSVALTFLMREEGADFGPLGGPVVASRAGGAISLILASGDAALARAADQALLDLRHEGRLMAMARNTLPLPEAVVPVPDPVGMGGVPDSGPDRSTASTADQDAPEWVASP